MQVRDQRGPAGLELGADGEADPALLRPREPPPPVQIELARFRAAEGGRVEDDRVPLEHAQIGSQEDRVPLAGEGRAEEPVVEIGEAAADLGGDRDWTEHRPGGDFLDRCHPAPVAEPR